MANIGIYTTWTILSYGLFSFALNWSVSGSKMGYHEVANDVNDVVIRGSLLILYPHEFEEWALPGLEQVVKKLSDLQAVGFKLTDKLVGDTLMLLEHRLNYIGETLVEAFATVRKKPKEDIYTICLTELLRPERNIEQHVSLDFIIGRIDKPEDKILYAFEKYTSTNHVVYEYMIAKFGAQSRVARHLYDKRKHTTE